MDNINKGLEALRMKNRNKVLSDRAKHAQAMITYRQEVEQAKVERQAKIKSTLQHLEEAYKTYQECTLGAVKPVEPVELTDEAILQYNLAMDSFTQLYIKAEQAEKDIAILSDQLVNLP